MTDEEVAAIFDRDDEIGYIGDSLVALFKKKGAIVSPHEALGVVAEEYHELIDAIRDNDRDETLRELWDLGVGALAAFYSLQPKD